MAAGEYRSCDVCGVKAFYDANLNYTGGEKVDGVWVYPTPMRFAGAPAGQFDGALENVGDWAVICTDCAKTYKCMILPIELPTTQPVAASQ